MSHIKVLPATLVNKIAAGEVIERPASVLKELLENSIDAGATRVGVCIEDGGRRLVAVSDDGGGMSREDLALAVAPHATSKIHGEEDLFNICTMGFRGEALASIASVSQLRMVSRLPEEAGGHEILVQGGQSDGPRPVAAPPGTTVEVRELFFNVPARRKFLKTANTEMSHITEQLIRIGLAHPHMHLVCTHNGRKTHDLPASGGADILEAIRLRIGGMFSHELAAALIPIDRQERGFRVFGLVGSPAEARGTAAWQYTWLNGRFIRDRFIQHAIRESYRGLLPEGRFPVVFLFLEVNPGDVDVNVHPTKIEVRFRDSNLVHSQVLAALRETFLRRHLTASLGGESLVERGPSTVCVKDRTPARTARPTPSGLALGEADQALRVARQREIRKAFAELMKRLPPDGGPTSPADQQTVPDQRPDSPTMPEAMPLPIESFASTDRGTAKSSPDGRAIQLHNTYLVTESADGLVIVDQHALHERIIYQQLADRISEGPLESQRLLLPETVAVTPTEMACLEHFGDLFRRLGLDLTPFGPTTVAVQALPSVLKDTDAADWVRRLLVRLADKPDQTLTDEFLFEILESMACTAAVKAGDPLTPEEIRSLLAKRDQVEKPSACPHGRPTALHLSIRELEKQFKRS